MQERHPVITDTKVLAQYHLNAYRYYTVLLPHFLPVQCHFSPLVKKANHETVSHLTLYINYTQKKCLDETCKKYL